LPVKFDRAHKQGGIWKGVTEAEGRGEAEGRQTSVSTAKLMTIRDEVAAT